MKLKALLLAAVAAVGMGGAASAATLTPVSVVWTGGIGAPAGSILGHLRYDEANAYVADGKFLSLGLGGSAIFSFGEKFRGPGSIAEVTYRRTHYLETADIYGFNSSGWTLLASVNNLGTGASVFSFSGVYSLLRVTDTSPHFPGRDGFDIDSITVTPVPVPAAGLLLGGALLGLGARKLRRKSA